MRHGDAAPVAVSIMAALAGMKHETQNTGFNA